MVCEFLLWQFINLSYNTRVHNWSQLVLRGPVFLIPLVDPSRNYYLSSCYIKLINTRTISLHSYTSGQFSTFSAQCLILKTHVITYYVLSPRSSSGRPETAQITAKICLIVIPELSLAFQWLLAQLWTLAAVKSSCIFTAVSGRTLSRIN